MKAQAGWPTAGGDPGGQRYSAAQQINKGNVKDLVPAWTYHTGSIKWETAADGSRHPSHDTRLSAFEATPVLFENTLYISTPADQIIALDPGTGREVWRYDPQIKYEAITSRGVAPWHDQHKSSGPCSSRLFLGTLDARLLSVDAHTGLPCKSFGKQGEVDLRKDVEFQANDYYGVNSPPAVVGDVIIVGSAIQDNSRVDVEKGVVRGYDARSGRLVWTWEPLSWAASQKLRTGSGNAWSYLSVDVEHGLVYIPTGSASPDFYGGLRPGDNRDADSVVALDGATGKRVWGFQTTHHNVWDYDVASQPLLFDYKGTPAVAITTKMGMIFVLNRLTGEPLYPITERPVPQSDVPGEHTSPTQPFSSLPTLSPIDWPKDTMWGANAEDDRYCRKLVSGLRYEGIYTPPSLEGTLLFPGNLGGVNWGSPAFDPATGILYADTNHYAFSVRLTAHKPLFRERLLRKLSQPKYRLRLTIFFVAVLLVALFLRGRWRIAGVIIAFAGFAGVVFLTVHARNAAEEEALMTSAHFGKEAGPQNGAPYAMLRQPLLARDGLPCTPQPWGTVSAVNLNTGKAMWRTPLGTVVPGKHTGTLNLGGPIVTAGGLLFTAASTEPYFWALDSTTGEELWTFKLTVPAQSTPMTYEYQGKQYVVLSDGGHGWFGTPVGDSVIAFALK